MAKLPKDAGKGPRTHVRFFLTIALGGALLFAVGYRQSRDAQRALKRLDETAGNLEARAAEISEALETLSADLVRLRSNPGPALRRSVQRQALDASERLNEVEALVLERLEDDVATESAPNVERSMRMLEAAVRADGAMTLVHRAALAAADAPTTAGAAPDLDAEEGAAQVTRAMARTLEIFARTETGERETLKKKRKDGLLYLVGGGAVVLLGVGMLVYRAGYVRASRRRKGGA